MQLQSKRIETKHITPLSKGGEGSEMPCSYKANEKETKHTTPLSPWRGAGGEAGSGGCLYYVRLSLRRFWRQFHIKQAIFFHHKRFGAIASEGEVEGGTNANGERVLAASVGLRRLSVGRYLYAN